MTDFLKILAIMFTCCIVFLQMGSRVVPLTHFQWACLAIMFLAFCAMVVLEDDD